MNVGLTNNTERTK